MHAHMCTHTQREMERERKMDPRVHDVQSVQHIEKKGVLGNSKTEGHQGHPSGTKLPFEAEQK